MSAIEANLESSQPQPFPLWPVAGFLALVLAVAGILFMSSQQPGANLPMQLPPNLPMPNCQELGLENCRWQGWHAKDGKEIRVELKAGKDTTIAEVELSEEIFTDVPALAKSGISRGWLGYIEVAEAFQGSGIGRIAWEVGDMVLRAYVGKGVYRGFIDKSGWGLRLMSGVTDIVYRDPSEGFWVYYLRRW